LKILETGQVLESPGISFHRSLKVLEFIKSNCAIMSNFVKQVFCLKQELLIIVMFCFYQLKLSNNHRNRY